MPWCGHCGVAHDATTPAVRTPAKDPCLLRLLCWQVLAYELGYRLTVPSKGVVKCTVQQGEVAGAVQKLNQLNYFVVRVERLFLAAAAPRPLNSLAVTRPPAAPAAFARGRAGGGPAGEHSAVGQRRPREPAHDQHPGAPSRSSCGGVAVGRVPAALHDAAACARATRADCAGAAGVLFGPRGQGQRRRGQRRVRGAEAHHRCAASACATAGLWVLRRCPVRVTHSVRA